MTDAYLKRLPIGSPDEHKQIRELMEKAERGTITYEEVLRLRELLERDRKRREDEGDILGALMIGLLLLFIIGLLAKLLAERR